MKQFSIGKTIQKTAFANFETRMAMANGAESGATRGRLIHIPGEILDTEFTDTVFVAKGSRPDLSQPVARYSVSVANNKADIVHKFFDSWGSRFASYTEDVSKQVTRGASLRDAIKVAVANIVNSQTVDATKSLGIMDRVLGLAMRNFFLTMCVTPVPAPNLVLTYDGYTEGTVQAKVPELKEPKLVSHAETRTTSILWKNVAHLAISEEAELMQLHNTMQLRSDRALKDLDRLQNSQIATVLETATGASGSDWGAVSGTPPDSANNPVTDIQGVTTTIRGNGVDVDYLAMHDRPAGDLLTNKFIQGRGNVGIDYQQNADRFIVPGLAPGVIDQALTNTVAIVGSRDAVWLGQGPTIVAAYNEDVIGYRGWLVKKYLIPVLTQSGYIRKLTGISA